MEETLLDWVSAQGTVSLLQSWSALTIEESPGLFSDSTRQHNILTGRGRAECLSCLVLLLRMPDTGTTAVCEGE